jgi:type IV pilus assembly protein PilA
MPRRLRLRLTHQHGFSLIEVLVVMLILGVLAAIALPAFLGQQQKGEDADAKSNARNLVSLVDACYTSKDDYTLCSDQASLGGNIGIPYGTNPGEANVAASTHNTFTVTAKSKASSGGANNTFSIARDASGVVSRSCSGGGGCHSGSW